MAATRYRKFLQLCERWPIDETKTDRDLGMYIRQRVAAAFQQGDASSVPDEQSCDRTYEALNRIATDDARRQYPRLKDSNVTGLTAEECQQVSSTEGQRTVRNQSLSIAAKLRRTLGGS